MRNYLLALGLIVLAAGCSETGVKLYPVSGKISVDGKPTGKLLITFEPVKGGAAAMGTTNEEGVFKLTTNGRAGAIEGEHKVSIKTIFEAEETPKVDSSAPSGGDAYMNQAAINPKQFKMPKETIPASYNTNSTLRRSVGPDWNDPFDFEIDTKAK